MPRTYYFTEFPHTGDGKRTIHKVTLPGHGEPKGYTEGLAMDYFAHGKRKAASKEDIQYHRANCNWGPKTIFSLKDEIDMDMSFQGTLDAVERIERLRKEKFPDEPPEPNLIEEQYGSDYKSWREIPTVDHDGMKAFFAHIGFDHKARGYVDPDGKPIKYSVITPKPKEKEKPAPGMEI